MRRITEIPAPPKPGDTRRVSTFTLVPISIVNDKYIERRWLERVTVEQVLCSEYRDNKWEYYWKDVKFVD